MLIADHAPALASGKWELKPAMEALWRVGVLGMALSYVCGIVLLFRHTAWRRRLHRVGESYSWKANPLTV